MHLHVQYNVSTCTTCFSTGQIQLACVCVCVCRYIHVHVYWYVHVHAGMHNKTRILTRMKCCYHDFRRRKLGWRGGDILSPSPYETLAYIAELTMMYCHTHAHAPTTSAVEFVQKVAGAEEQHAKHLHQIVGSYRRKTQENLKKDA